MVTIIGTVLDEITEEPVQGAEVRVGDNMRFTDREGEFSMNIKEGEYTITISKSDYVTLEEGLHAYSNKATTYEIQPMIYAQEGD